MESHHGLAGRRVVITGGAGVLGGAMAEHVAAQRARVCILDYDAGSAEELCRKIVQRGGECLAVRGDATDRASMERAADRAVEGLGGVDVLLNCAGGNHPDATTSPERAFFDLPPAALRSTLDLNLLGTILPCQVFGRHLAQQGEGVILNVSSLSGSCPLTKVVAYSAAKAAVSNFTRWLAVHMCQEYSARIRVNALAPGFFLTKQNRYLLTDEETGEPTARGRQILEQTPMARFGRPEDLLGAVSWLLGDGSRFVTGTVVTVDGGFEAYSGV